MLVVCAALFAAHGVLRADQMPWLTVISVGSVALWLPMLAMRPSREVLRWADGVLVVDRGGRKSAYPAAQLRRLVVTDVGLSLEFAAETVVIGVEMPCWQAWQALIEGQWWAEPLPPNVGCSLFPDEVGCTRMADGHNFAGPVRHAALLFAAGTAQLATLHAAVGPLPVIQWANFMVGLTVAATVIGWPAVVEVLGARALVADSTGVSALRRGKRCQLLCWEDLLVVVRTPTTALLGAAGSAVRLSTASPSGEVVAKAAETIVASRLKGTDSGQEPSSARSGPAAGAV